ncbi:cytochrome P450 [Phycomyces nitens]|nr:cytochrome P450 [Phycomyces nitens]
MTKHKLSLFVVLKGSDNVERDGKMICFDSGDDLDTIRGHIADALSIMSPKEEILLLDDSESILNSRAAIFNQQLVYVDLKDQIKHTIPGPISIPFVGSLYEMLPNITESWVRQFEKYGPLVYVKILGTEMINTNCVDIAEVFSKESEYFTKNIKGSVLNEVKRVGLQGLFTTDTNEIDWKLGHQLLMPAFSTRAIKAYQMEMGKLVQQTIRNIEQIPQGGQIDVIDLSTRLTFETIGRIGFGYKFGLIDSLESPSHPFIGAMSYCLQQAVVRTQQAGFIRALPIEANRAFDRSLGLMHDTVDEVIQDRKRTPKNDKENKDLLDFMLYARNEDNLGLSDENIRDQVVTFLIAGHDTTANTVSWALYEISRSPEVEAQLVQEIVNSGITADELPTSEQISNLKYTTQIIKETLRRYPPIRIISRMCKKDCVIPGGYLIKKGSSVGVHLYSLHHNPSLYPNPYQWDPNRWTPEEEQKRSRYSWMPFSTGPRACIGMAFSIQEIKTTLAMLLQKYRFCYDGPPICFDAKMATTKPCSFMMTIEPRTSLPMSNIPLENVTIEPKKHVTRTLPQLVSSPATKLPKITFLYGSQTGGAQDYASQLSFQAQGFGFKDITLCELDKWSVLETERYIAPKEKGMAELVVICSATYNGLPPDNAEIFNRFLEEKEAISGYSGLSGLLYTVFGIGNKNWRTYQYFPIKIDRLFEAFGAQRLFKTGRGNADKDIDAQFNEWCADFWTHTLGYYGVAISTEKSLESSKDLNQTNTKVIHIRPAEKTKWKLAADNSNGDHNAMITVNKELQSIGSNRSTRHIKIDISSFTPDSNEMLYKAGDHLEIWPKNSPDIVEAVAINFGWVLDSVFEVDPNSIKGASSRSLATNINGPCTVRNALTCYADISSPPSRRMLLCFLSQLRNVSPDAAKDFEKQTTNVDNIDPYPAFIEKHRTLLDLQKAYPQVNSLDLGQFLAAVGFMHPRRYSIASSPLVHPKEAHIVVGLVDDLVNGSHYYGLTSSYLYRSNGIFIRASLKSSKNIFELPADPTVPIIMIAAGTGLAPFRGFLQERAFQHSQGVKIGSCTLFFGCRHPEQDYIFSDELEQYEKDGILSKFYISFSRNTRPTAVKYVQHQLLVHSSEIWDLVVPTGDSKPANVYVCGSGAMSREIRRTFYTMATYFGETSNEQEAQLLLQKWIDSKRFNEDVWG